jgi:hypothetical protein
MGEIQAVPCLKKEAVKRAKIIAVAMHYKYVGVIAGGATPCVRVMNINEGGN